MKKIIVLSALALALSACGGDSGSKKNNSSSSATSTSAAATSTSSSVVSSSSSSAASNWELVWSDEFDGASLDTSKWSFEKNCTGGGNNELQCYTDRSENANVSDGKLHIIARKETFKGQSKSDDEPGYNANDTSVTRDYTSARLRSKNKGDWKYGRMEIKAKLPQGQGVWPAIWMLPTEWKYGGWPRSGEIDIMEAVNSNAAGGNKVYGTLHYGDSWPNNKYTGSDTTPATNIWDEFHTYAVEWEEGEIRWYVDKTHFATQTKDGWYNYYWDGQEKGFKIGDGAAPFDQLFHMILNIAVGGNWPGNPNAASSFPQQMDVDFVRVYRCKLDTVTGKGCASDVDPKLTPLTGTAKPVVKTFSLFNNGVATLNFTVNGKTESNTLVPNFYDGGQSGNVVYDAAKVEGDNKVWDIQFNASPGNVYLMSSPMTGSTAVDAGFNFVGMNTNGELKFDLYVESVDPGTKLAVKVDSGWPNLSYREIELPEAGKWVSVSVPFEKLLDNNIQAGTVNWEKISNPIVFEPSGGKVHIKVNNIRVQCLSGCDVKPVLKAVSSTLDKSFDVFVDDVDANWDFGIGTWDEGGGGLITTAVVDAAEAERGKVIDMKWGTSGKNGVAFIQSTGTKNVTALAGGTLSFDIKVFDYGSNTTGIVVKSDCVNPCSSGDVPVGIVGNGAWQTVTVPVSTLVSGGLNLSKVNTPFVILPTWGSQQGVHLQLDNIRWIKP